MNNINDVVQPKGLLLGEYRAVVVSVDDPDQLMRVQIRLLNFWDALSDSDLPWAEYKLPIGASINQGGFEPCSVEDLVWVDFIGGDSRCPRITGSCHYAPDNIPNMPHEAFEGESKHEHIRLDDEPQVPPAQYHKTVVYSRFGVLIEISEDGSYRLTHKESGTNFEFTADGDAVHHTEGNTFKSGTGNVNEKFLGNQLIEVGGTSNTTITGVHNKELKDLSTEVYRKHKTINADKDWSLNVSGKVNINVTGNASITAEKIELNGGSGVVTKDSTCAYTGAPHSHCSSTVTAGM
ncbi:hypothetical protein KO527_05365 [Pseudoalteromonas sp. C2R02]|uniref:phage baseplate assembly protein V n=1 Tax=Pseudoalteromonas sp. C2R02 TaxID=2841565 RepID=UPI001C099C76|nr:phage baseplate assembly protein V [Pseudoalteromonas sp. C2R02]MBU2968777.1 hypothetical protein [Pseudoalteromonas sp. C2R02]